MGSDVQPPEEAAEMCVEIGTRSSAGVLVGRHDIAMVASVVEEGMVPLNQRRIFST